MNEDYVSVKVLFFAKAREVLGKKESYVEVPQKILGKDLLKLIIDKYFLNRLKCNVVLALNENWIDLETVVKLKNGDEIAVIPPLSGGLLFRLKMDWLKLTKDKLNVDSIYQQVCSPEFGAVSIFVGTTRNFFEEKVVIKLEYEAYEGMAKKSLESICQNIRKKFEVGNIAIYHRLGDVPIGEASVVIAISSTHRKPALEAVPFAIDALKAEVPIWKKEVYEDEKSSKWKENSESQDLIPPDSSDCVQLYEEVVEANLGNEVPANMIQIHANLQEINRRINSFIDRKRQQINESNIQDFFPNRTEENSEESTCARVSTVLIRRKDSKSHLKVHRVENVIGPQTHSFDSGSSPHLEDSVQKTSNCPTGAEERLLNAEQYLNIHKTSKDVFARLKAIEDKILYLESISPEYFDFDKEDKRRFKGSSCQKRTYSAFELDEKMKKLEAKLQKRTNNC